MVFSAYAPHSGKPLETRQSFYNDLDLWITRQSPHGPLLIMGDFNARLHGQFDFDSVEVGPHILEIQTRISILSKKSLFTTLEAALVINDSATFGAATSIHAWTWHWLRVIFPFWRTCTIRDVLYMLDHHLRFPTSSQLRLMNGWKSQLRQRRQQMPCTRA